jgi:hypothetical protein
MTGTPPQTGDVIDITVAASKPFGTFVQTEPAYPGSSAEAMSRSAPSYAFE